MNLLIWITFGLLAGFALNYFMPSRTKDGIVDAILLGIVGSLVGGSIAQAFLYPDTYNLQLSTLSIAVGGALILAAVNQRLRQI